MYIQAIPMNLGSNLPGFVILQTVQQLMVDMLNSCNQNYFYCQDINNNLKQLIYKFKNTKNPNQLKQNLIIQQIKIAITVLVLIKYIINLLIIHNSPLQIMTPQTTKYDILPFALLFICILGYMNKLDNNYLSQFEKWKITFSIKYETDFQNLYREKLYLKKKFIVEQHNSNPNSKYDRGMNKFSALSQAEFRQIFLTYVPQHGVQVYRQRTQVLTYPQVNVNTIIDWRTQGVVGPIKDQGTCGSCWAFSTVAGLQAASKIFYGTLKSFSEQQLIDCDLLNRGCVGGAMRLALDYVKNHGIQLQEQYPYKGVRGVCRKLNGNFHVSGHTNVTGCNNLANALTARPLIVGVDANAWDDYESGIFDNCKNDTNIFNHGVLLIGMTSQYWLVKNSFGTKWGQNGFMRLAYGNTCNICDDGIMIQK